MKMKTEPNFLILTRSTLPERNEPRIRIERVIDPIIEPLIIDESLEGGEEDGIKI